MNSKTYGIVIGAIVVLALVGAIFYFSGNSPSGQQNSSSENYTPSVSAPVQESPRKNQTEAPVSNSKPVVNSQQQTKEIVFTDSGFSPPNITIKAGTIVVFRNNSSRSFRPASNPHPIHNGYPTTGGCVSSTFDACKSISPGGSWSFKFDILGSWGYHDHLNSLFKGVVVVQ